MNPEDIFASPEEKKTSGVSASDIFAGVEDDGDEFAGPDSRREQSMSNAERAAEDIREESSQAGDPLDTPVGEIRTDFGAMMLGQGSKLYGRLMNAVGGMDDADLERLLQTIDEDRDARVQRSPVMARAGDLAGDVARTAILAPIAGFTGAGAAQGGGAAYSESGDALDTTLGAVGGGVAGRGAQALGGKVSAAGQGLRSTGKAMRAAGAQGGQMALPGMPGAGVANTVGSAVNKAVRAAGSAMGLGGMATQAVGSTLPYLGIKLGQEYAAGPGLSSKAEAQFSYADMMPAPGPSEPHADAHYAAFAEAYDDPALQSRTGLAGDLADLMTRWSQGEEPSASDIALMSFRLSEVPGLSWASLDPLRATNEEDD